MLIAAGDEDDMLLVRAHAQRLAEGPAARSTCAKPAGASPSS